MMPSKERGGADPLAQAIIGRHRLDVAVVALVLGESAEGGDYMFRRGVYYTGVDRGVEIATRITLEKVASGEITQVSARELLVAAGGAVDTPA